MAKIIVTYSRAFMSVCFILCMHACALSSEKAAITIHAQKEKGAVNKMVFGTNFIGYDPNTYENWPVEFRGYSDHGAGVWDLRHNKPVFEAMELAKSAGVSVMRFPGGCGAHRYDWKAAIGKDRLRFLFGLDEFLKECEEINAIPVFTVSYFAGNEADAADLVEYLNAYDDKTNPNQGIDWAAVRAQNGHPEPYRVEYFEFGNEDWHGDHKKVRSISPEAYGKRYCAYSAAMKQVDPSIKVGVILCVPEWDKRVMNIIGERIDFGIVHMYPDPGEDSKKITSMAANDIFSKTLDRIGSTYEGLLQDTLKLLKEKAKKPVPLAMTEYNAGFTQEKPVPYRHCLGSALVNAELLRVMMQPENKILMANYWQFVNSYWGMAYSSDDYKTHDYTTPIEYVKRPNYFVYELYNSHFGTELIEADIASGASNITVNASKDSDGNSIYVMVVNKNMEKAIECTIEFDDSGVVDTAGVWVLNAAKVDATNEGGSLKVEVKEGSISGADSVFSYSFEPHSLTAIEFTGKEL